MVLAKPPPSMPALPMKDYFNHSENLTRLPNHRLLAMLRGRQENVLTLKVDGEDTPFIEQIISHFALNDKQPMERQTS